MSIEKINLDSTYGKFNVPQKKVEVENTQNGDDHPQIRDDVEVSLTDKALQLQKVDRDEGIDRAKVEAIKKSIAEGTFKIDAEKIVDKMIQQELELYKRNK